MLFNSFEFFIFLPIVYLGYWFLNRVSLKFQNIFLLLASYVFYGWWDYRFLSLILFSSLVDYFIGLALNSAKDHSSRKKYLWVSIICNLGLLGFFKYYNFFIDSFIESFIFLGGEIQNVWTLKIILPVGISFYTFQTLSYTLDIYKGKLKPTRDFIAFSTFVSFFPQLVAGPIERASQLLPQVLSKRRFKYTQQVEGLKLMLWGLFKKVAIADSLAPIVDDIFLNSSDYPSSTLLLGAVFFGFQIYGDFSGYSDLAIGSAKLFGIELRSNFKFPYFSRNIAEFWRRWHISLSTWFRDYVYIPLGGSKATTSMAIRNIFVIFLISGFWHGANWTFLVWGGFHALLFVPVFLTKNNRNYLNTDLGQKRLLPAFKETTKVLFTFFLVSISWVLFRAESLAHGLEYVQSMLLGWSYESYSHPFGYRMVDYFILLLFFVAYEYRIRRNERNPYPFSSRLIRFICYAVTILGLFLFFDSGIDRSFIYFQF